MLYTACSPSTMLTARILSTRRRLSKGWPVGDRNDALRWTFKGVERKMVLEEDTIEAVLAKLKEWSRTKRGIPFAEFHKNVSKVQHASKGIPVDKALFTPISRMLSIWPEHKLVFVRPNSGLEQSIKGFQVLLHKAHKEPTKYKQLVTGDPHS